MDYLDVLFLHESNEIRDLNKSDVHFHISERQKVVLPKISSIANASKILDAPTRPERHAEKVAAIIPITTNGSQILISCRKR